MSTKSRTIPGALTEGAPTAEPVRVRPAEERDVVRLGELAGALVRMHHAEDPARFLEIADVEEGYGRWLAREMRRAGAVVLVAELEAEVVGYAYGTLEKRDWNRLLDDHGAIQDVFVAQEARRVGAGRLLLKAMIEALEQRGAPRIVLSTMVGNDAAQRLFAAMGFRPTMVEMTRTRSG